MGMKTIEDFKNMPEANGDYKIISYALGQLEITVSQDILSESTRELLIAAVDVWTTGAYGFVRGNERALYAAIRSDLTQHVLTRVSDKVHPRDALSKIGI